MSTDTGYKCDPQDCAIIIKENGQLDFIYPNLNYISELPKNVLFFKEVIKLINNQMLNDDNIAELVEKMKIHELKPTLH